MSKPTIEQVQEVINTLYGGSSDPSSKEKASEWLGHLQRSVHAWEIADHLLRLNVSLEASYFAAQTMRTKIQYYFHELQVVQYESLKDSLINHLSTLHGLSHAILTQLCLALADLAVQMPQWTNVVNDFAQRFGNKLNGLPVLLELLVVLPEEVDSHHLRVGANRRRKVTEELTASAPVVLQILNVCLEKCSNNASIRVMMLRCAGSWILLGAFPPAEIANSKLLQVAFHDLRRPDASDTLHEAAADFICNALYTSEHLNAQLALAETLFKYVMTLPPAYETAMNDEDFDRSLNLCRVFTEMGESYLNVIVTTPGKGLGDLRILTILLACVKHPQYEVAEVTFNFWYRLSEALFKEDNVNKTALFKPYIESLFEALCVHCRMEPDSIRDGIVDDSNEFGEFRARVSDVVKDCVFIVGSTNSFAQMYQSLSSQGSNISWEVTEAILFVMSNLARNVSLESEIVAQFLPTVLNLPADCPIGVRKTSIQLVGELSGWVEKHPAHLDSVLQFFLVCIQTRQLASVSALSLESLCLSCHLQLGRHFDVLAQVVVAVDSLTVSNDAAVRLIKGVSKVVESLPHERLPEGVKSMCTSQIGALKQILSAPSQSYPDPTVWLDRLAAVFRFANPKPQNGTVHPFNAVVEELCPILISLCDKYKMEVKIIERCCRCIRFTIRCLGKSAINFLSPLVSQMVRVYGVVPHSCFLYLGSILVDEYGTEEALVPGLIGMTQAFSGIAFQQLSAEKGLVEHPDTVDDMFRLLTRCLQQFPVQFLQCDVAEPAVQCAIAAVELEHREANQSVMKFLRDLVHAAAEKEAKDLQTRVTLVRGILSQNGQSIIKGLISACAGVLPTFMILDVAEVLWEFISFCKQETSQWIQVSLQSLPNQAVPGHEIATLTQLHEFHRAITSAPDVETVSKTAKNFSRLFR